LKRIVISQPIRLLIRFREIDADVFKPWRRYHQSQHLTQIVSAYGTAWREILAEPSLLALLMGFIKHCV
jgi:hypothetical protein